MLSRLFTLTILALSVVVSSSTLPVVDETAATIVKRQCKPVCCDLLVKAHDNSLDGVSCSPGGVDCAFTGQLTACCALLIPGSTNARGCTESS
ncbi:hypothetical protein V495_06703 [Pseudogymnoascus sp. VKM F-4514 (FW-929)]|nr:hypothetical protein V495_06703 [Pseudogymnoascus sp. VKM F-4514 (FW-929)]KFY51520.1 hypothetical protein V497_09059 [Pseudogymnoascus sp. VKM F-4516 (FW-969)]